MSLTKLIEDLSENSENLRAAMYTGDAVLIEDALETFRAAVERVRTASAGPLEAGFEDKLTALMPKLDESHALSRILADMTGQMHDLVAARARDVRQPLYARTGERFA